MEFFIVIALTHFLALLSPGPDFFLLLTTLLRYSAYAARWVAWGIALGNALILLGLILLLNQLGQLNSNLLMGLRYIGAAYLGYLAYLCIRYAHQPLELKSEVLTASHTISHYQLLGLGLQSSLLNPKNWMFYSSLMMLMTQQVSLFYKIAMSGWMVMVVLLWNMSVVSCLTQPRWIQYLQRYTQHIHYISGMCFSAFAIALLVV